MRLLQALALACLPIAATAAFAAEPEPAEKPAPAKEDVKEAKEEKKICKRIAADMSSRRRTKVCKTRAEWKQYYRQ